MIIQHNIAALNSYRQLSTNNSAVAKNLEKLSSGYKINRAGDDAAGLAISEKMRAQITGLEKAQDNANDGISLVQTAEGALTEVHDMLNRMVELATQSSNGTYSDDVDRENLQAEVESLKEEIDRISKSTNFNGINLLDGSLGASGGATTSVKVDYAGLDSNADFLKLNSATKQKLTISFTGANDAEVGGAETSLEIKFSDADGNLQTKTITFKAANADLADAGNDSVITKALQDAFGDDYTVAGGTGSFTIEAKNGGSSEFEIYSIEAKKSTGVGLAKNPAATVTTKGADAYYSIDVSKLPAFDGTNADKAVFEINGQKFAFTDAANAGKLDSDVNYIEIDTANPDGTDSTAMATLIKNKTGIDASSTTTTISLKESKKSGTSGKGLVLQIGDTADDFNKITVQVDSMDTASLGIAGVDISTAAGADAAISKIKEAINTVSSTRGNLGAIQNRLEHTINNLGVTTENITSAESRIRDTDMADEMMAYTKNNILVQASQAMLAQANTLPQGVLQLLQ